MIHFLGRYHFFSKHLVLSLVGVFTFILAFLWHFFKKQLQYLENCLQDKQRKKYADKRWRALSTEINGINQYTVAQGQLDVICCVCASLGSNNASNKETFAEKRLKLR